jgi:uncharacterized protein YkwD
MALGVRRSRRIAVTLCFVVTMLLAGAALNVSSASAATPSAATSASIARALLHAINTKRASSHLPALRMDARLMASAHRHNLAMAHRDTMSHQLPGEATFSARISGAGYDWSSAGENIAWNSDWTLRGAIALERYMNAEVAPNNAHKLNIVSKSFRDVGVDIYMDAAHHRMWLTQDFGRTR